MIEVMLLVASAVTFSTAGIFTKGVVAGAWAVIFWRGLFAAAFTTGWTISQGTFRSNFFCMGYSGWAVGIVGAIGTAAFIPAFKLTSIANVSLIYATAPADRCSACLASHWRTHHNQNTGRLILRVSGRGIIVSGSIGRIGIQGDTLALVMTTAMAVIMVIYRKYPDTPGAGPSVLQSLILLPPSFALGAPFRTGRFVLDCQRISKMSSFLHS